MSGAEDLTEKGRRKLSGMMRMFYILTVAMVIWMELVNVKSNAHLQPSLPHLTLPQMLLTCLPSLSYSKCWQSYSQSDKGRTLPQDSGKVSTSLTKGINITDAALSPHLTALSSEMMPRAMAIGKQSGGKEQKSHRHCWAIVHKPAASFL